MKMGMFERAFPDGMSLGEGFALVKQAGFEGVELALHDTSALLPEAQNEYTVALIRRSGGNPDRGVPGGLYLDSTPAEIQSIGRLAREQGLVVTGLSTGQFRYYPLSSGIPRVRERALALGRKMIEAAALLGAGVVQIVPGEVTPEDSYPEVWQRSHEALSTLVPYARDAGVVLAIENVWNRFLYSPIEFRDYIDSFHTPTVGAYFDIGNVVRYGYPEQWITMLGPRLKGVHFKDYRLDLDNFGGFTYLLQGDIAWPRVMCALRQAAYDGWAVVEVSPYRADPAQAILDSAAALRRLLNLAL